jgi:pyruvate dehydrogenase E1 component alpha subunit
MAIYMGRLEAGKIPDDLNMLVRQLSVAAQLPHAVGLAWAQSLRRTGAIVMVYCGEGASSEGDFHEACNLAGVLRAPVIFVVQNNAWAISTPLAKQTAARSLAARAPGYGFVGYVVDGNDLFAVNEVARVAAERARSGQGPTLIENVTYRVGFHNTSDNPNLYRDAAEVEAAMRLDPIARVERYLSTKGAWSEPEAAETRTRADQEIRTAIKSASEHALNDWTAVFAHSYAEAPPRLLKQRAKLESEVAPG